MVTFAVWLAVAPFAIWAIVRVGGWERGFAGITLIAFTPYVAGAAQAALLLAVASRRWWAAAVAAAATVALLACVLPRWVRDDDAARAAVPGPHVVFMSANLRAGEADPDRILGLVRDRRVDLLALQELTPAAERALDAAGLSGLLPYHVTGPVDGVGGSALYSRHPLTSTGLRHNPGGFFQAYGIVTVPGAQPVAVESMHPAAPATARGAADLGPDLATAPPATVDGPVRVLIGDFNSTLDHAVLRRLIGTGYRDAAATVGAGLIPTWPYFGPRSPVTPKVTIDHVLADRRIGVEDFHAFTVARTDHRAIVATLVLPA